MEATKPLKPPVERVASGDSASLQVVTRVNAEQASRTENRQGRHGAAPGDGSVLDVAQGVGLRASEKVRFAGSKTLLSYSVDQGFDSIA